MGIFSVIVCCMFSAACKVDPNHETAVNNHWTGLLEWTTGLALKIILILRFNYLDRLCKCDL